jgi:predicted AAA+ superfamily ATPase
MSISSVIPTAKIIERLHYENLWRVSKAVHSAYQNMQKRLYFDLFYPFVKEKDFRRAVVLMGPRRVGKTVMMFHSIDQLIQEEVDPQKIFFVGIDNPLYLNLSLEDILCCVGRKPHNGNIKGRN